MVWGQAAARGVDDLAQRLRNNDPGLESLTILRLRRLNDEDVELISNALTFNTVLEELICSSHAISPQAASKLGAALQHNSNLQSISIGSSSFGDQAVDALVTGGLLHNTGLTHWDLEHKGVSQACAASVAQVLQRHPKLQQISLARNHIGDQGVQQLCAVPWTRLVHLDLSDSGITHQGLAAIAAAPSISQLQHLDVSSNPLGTAAATGLQQLLVNAKQLQSLRTRGAGIGDSGAQGIAGGLSAVMGSKLLLLDLSSTGLGSAGVAALAAAVAAAGAKLHLQQLLLGGNPAVGDDAICKLADSIQAAAAAAEEAQTKSLMPGQQQQQLVLDISQSGVGPEGLKVLSWVQRLSSLSLFGCQLGGSTGVGCAALVVCISSGGFAQLQDLNITGCELSLQQLRAVMEAVSSDGVLPSLGTLELGANPGIQDDGFEELVGQLRAKRPGLDVHWRVADSDSAPNQS